MSYDDRPAELREQIDLLSEATPEELTRMKQGVEEYARDRTSGLQALPGIISDVNRADRADDFTTAFEFVRLAVMSSLDPLLEGIGEPSHSAWLFREKALVEDDRFFDTLEELRLGDKRDQMMAMIRNLEDLTKALDAKWLSTTEEERRIEELEMQAARRMNEALSKALDEMLGIQTRLSGALGEVVKELGEVPDALNLWVEQTLVTHCGIDPQWAKVVSRISEPGKDVFEEAKKLGMPAAQVAKLTPYLTPDFGMKVGEYLKKVFGSGKLAMIVMLLGEVRKTAQVYLSGWYSEALGELRRQLGGTGAIITTFSRTRQGVDEFIRNNGVDAARKFLDEVVAAIDRWAGEQATEGLRADADTLADSLKQGFGSLFQEMEKVFDTFVRDNKSRFFGPVSSDVQSTLLNLREWKDAENTLLGMHLDERLREWRDQAMAIEPDAGDAFRQIQKHLVNLPVNIQTALGEALNAEQRRFTEEVNAVNVQVVAELGAAEKQVSPEAIRQTFDRSPLVAQLTG